MHNISFEMGHVLRWRFTRAPQDERYILTERMNLKLQIIIGGLLVSIIGGLSIVANYPRIYSPCSLIVVIPALSARELDLPMFFTYILGIFPLTIFYLIWSFTFVKQPDSIPKPTAILAAICIVLSVAFNISSYKYGIQYQGQLHTYLMYFFNLILIIFMCSLFKSNKSNPNNYNGLGFNVLLFSWLGWVAFPWLGKLI